MTGAALTLLTAASVSVAARRPVAPDLLAVMARSGAVERFDSRTGRWKGTFIRGVSNPSGIAIGPDDNVYVSVGPLGGAGAVKRYDGRTGRFMGDFIPARTGTPDAIVRGAGIVFHQGDLYVSSIDSGRILRYDGRTGAFKSEFARGPNTSMTQIAFHGDSLYASDFVGAGVRRYDAATGVPRPDAVRRPGFTPWGIAFDLRGRLYWSGGPGEIRRWDGTTDAVWAGPAPELATPLYLAFGPGGRLFCSGHGADAITVWSAPDSGAPARQLIIRHASVRGPAGLAFIGLPWRVRKPLSVTSRKEETSPMASGASVVRFEALPDRAEVTHLGWDTEGGDRARLNMLRAPVTVRAKVGGVWSALDTPARPGERGLGTVLYSLPLGGGRVEWRVRAVSGGIDLELTAKGRLNGVEALSVRLPLNPGLAATSVFASEWTDDGRPALPLIVSVPDLGQMLVTCSSPVSARYEGSRTEQWVDLTCEVAAPLDGTTTIRFRPIRLAPPAGFTDRARWRKARRGWMNFLQLSAARAAEGGHAATPGGLWANNVISDPVSSTVFWLADCALLLPELAPGVAVAPVLRRTVDFWIDNKMNSDGVVSYVVSYTQDMMDANPSVLIGAWAYVEGSGDTAWLSRRVAKLEQVAGYLERRDVDGDGLIESRQSGNRGTHAFGDTAWDTYSSGHKNAYVNALAYRAFLCMADLYGRLGDDGRRRHYVVLADRVKAIYERTFFNPETGWLGWWRSQDGMLHDVHSDVPTGIAVLYGLVEPARGREMLDAYWRAVEKSGFRRFDLGLPLNIRPVHRDDQFAEWGGKKEDGSDTFGKYLNGGCCVSNTYFSIAANAVVGRTARADKLLDAMLDRQHKGVFPNGGGFQNGVVDRYPEGAEFFDWNGGTCGYEGHLVYSWTFLHAMLLKEPALRAKVLGLLR